MHRSLFQPNVVYQSYGNISNFEKLKISRVKNFMKIHLRRA